MRFGPAIDKSMTHGSVINRVSVPWESVMLRLPDGRSDLNSAYFVKIIKYPDEDITMPWLPSSIDMTAHDWEVVDES